MSDIATRTDRMLDAWRGQPAERLDPIRFHFIQALASRANQHEGKVRRILRARLSVLVDAYAADLESSNANLDMAAPVPTSARGVLGVLVDQLAVGAVIGNDLAPATEIAADEATFPDMPTLDEFQKLWATLRCDSQLQQSLQQVNTDAGPLNSGTLVHRAILLMRELAPGYLQHFLSYVDSLSWMEKMQADGVLASSGKPVTKGRKQSTNRALKRRG